MPAHRIRTTVALASLAAIPMALGVASPASAATTANSWDDLRAAFAAVPPGGSETIVLGADIVSQRGENLVVPDGGGIDGASVILDLAGHSLTISAPFAPANSAAIGVYRGAALEIADSVGAGRLDVTGADSYGAGIGADWSAAGGTDNTDPGSITILGGNITATGGRYGAAIGGTRYATGGDIDIRGGIVFANGGFQGPGVGAGALSGLQDNPGAPKTGIGISIADATVIATGGDQAPGVGGSIYGRGSAVTVRSSTVEATAGTGGAAGIGGGWITSSAPISIIDSVVVAEGSSYTGAPDRYPTDQGGAGIGAGPGLSAGDPLDILIQDSNVRADGGIYAAGIGSGSWTDNATVGARSVTISDSEVVANGGAAGAGIGGGRNLGGVAVTITHDSRVTATGGDDTTWGGGAGIGSGGSARNPGTLTLEGVPGLGSATTAGNGGDSTDGAGDAGRAATVTGDGADLVFDVVAVDGNALGQGGSARVTWQSTDPAAPADSGTTPAGQLASTGPGDFAPGFGVAAFLILIGALLAARRRRTPAL